MAQTFLTYEQQVNLLQNDKELCISDFEFAKTILQKISYYSLIDGYKEPFKPFRSGKYYYGVTFEEIFSFYTFDEELRSLFLKYILKVEQHMKLMHCRKPLQPQVNIDISIIILLLMVMYHYG